MLTFQSFVGETHSDGEQLAQGLFVIIKQFTILCKFVSTGPNRQPSESTTIIGGLGGCQQMREPSGWKEVLIPS